MLPGGTEPLLSPSATAMFQPATGLAACVVPPEETQEALPSHLQGNTPMPALAALGVTKIVSPMAARANAALAGIDAALVARWRGAAPPQLAADIGNEGDVDNESDAPSSASSHRVEQLVQQVAAMQEQMLQQFSTQQQMALQAQAREDALQKKVDALEAERAGKRMPQQPQPLPHVRRVPHLRRPHHQQPRRLEVCRRCSNPTRSVR